MAINVYQWCKDICSWSLINGPDIKLGGPGQIVQIDESLFTHQGKVCAILIALYKIVKHNKFTNKFCNNVTLVLESCLGVIDTKSSKTPILEFIFVLYKIQQLVPSDGLHPPHPLLQIYTTWVSPF